MSEITMDSLSIDKVAQKLFFLHNAPTKPMVAASYFQDPSFNNGNYAYQVNIAIYLPIGITNLAIKKWSSNSGLFISECPPNEQQLYAPDGNFRQITIEFDNIKQFYGGVKLGMLPSLLNQNTVELELYMIQFRYHTSKKDTAENIFVNYTYGDPETTRGTVTTVRDISETQTS